MNVAIGRIVKPSQDVHVGDAIEAFRTEEVAQTEL